MFMSRWRQPEFVWYAAYGSNLHLERFRGQVLPLAIPYQLFFAGESQAGAGGVAFIKAGDSGRTHSRAYLVSFEQYRLLVCEENNVTSVPPLPVSEAIAGGSAIIPGLAGRYDQIVFLGHRGRYPVLTTTSSRPPELNSPASEYLLQMILGLQDLQHRPDEVVAYLQATPGIGGRYSAGQLRDLEQEAGRMHARLIGRYATHRMPT